MKILSRLSRYIKIIIIVVMLSLVVSTSNGSEFKVQGVNNFKTDLTLMAMKVEEDIQNDIYSAKETYYGDLTGYGANCPLCGGTLACMPSLDVLHGNVNYTDETYGTVRIVASSRNLPCGTIIRFDSKRISEEPTIAIVLDRGVLGYNLDLLTESEDYASQYVGRIKLSYDVLRKGW